MEQDNRILVTQKNCTAYFFCLVLLPSDTLTFNYKLMTPEVLATFQEIIINSP